MNFQFTRLKLAHQETGACVLFNKPHGLNGNVEKRWLGVERNPEKQDSTIRLRQFVGEH